MTYAIARSRAGQSLCGSGGTAIIQAFRRARRDTRAWPVAWLFIGPGELNSPELLKRVRALSPDIGLIIRAYGRAETAPLAELMMLAKRQRRPCLLAPRGALGFGRHVPQWQRPPRRALQGLSMGLSMSVHTAAQAMKARRSGADMVFVSPVFKTQSHVGAATLGLFQARRLARLSGVRAYALGGMDTHNVRLLGPGFDGFAGISSLLGG